MRWRKLGLVFNSAGEFPWMLTHAANPVVEKLDGSVCRVYFSTRDNNNRSSIGTVEFDLEDIGHIRNISKGPVLEPGSPGLFDDSGASMSCLVTLPDGIRYLYYLGWNLGVTVPWRDSIGLAISPSKGADFSKYSPAPVVDRSAVDPYSVSYPWILREGNRWRMWYGSNKNWGKEQQEMAHLLKYAESSDGIKWERMGIVVIDFRNSEEYAISKPCVIKDPDCYRMWFSYRGDSYRICYAESQDGVQWTRLDERAGIDVSASGWNSESIEYPCVFDHKGKRFMLYNGNGYGRTGFGLAMLEQ